METWFWILGWSLSIPTMTGNGFVIFVVYRKRQLRTKTNAFVVSLAAADFCMGMSAVPSLFFCKMAGRRCDRIYFVWGLFMYASVVNLCSLVLDRYMAVVKPFKYLTFMKRRRVIQMISLSWEIPVAVTAFLSSLWFGLRSHPIHPILSGWLYTIFELLPCVFIIFCFVSMLRVIYKHDRSTRTLAKQLRFNHRVSVKTQDKSAVKMMAIVVVLFLVCYGIILRCSFVLIFYGVDNSCDDLQYKVPLLVLNSSINPLAYAIFKRDIKKEFKRLIYIVILKKRN